MKTYTEFLKEYNMTAIDAKDLDDIKDHFNAKVDKMRKAFIDYLVNKGLFGRPLIQKKGRDTFITAVGHETTQVNITKGELMNCKVKPYFKPQLFSSIHAVYEISPKHNMTLNGVTITPGFGLVWVNNNERQK